MAEQQNAKQVLRRTPWIPFSSTIVLGFLEGTKKTLIEQNGGQPEGEEVKYNFKNTTSKCHV